MQFQRSDIIPKETGAWAILLGPFLAGTFAVGFTGISSLLLLVCIVSLFTLRSCGEYYLSNIIKKKKTCQNISSFYLHTLSILAAALITAILLLFYFHLWNLLTIGAAAFILFGLYYSLELKNIGSRINQQFIAFLGLTLTAPAAFYVTTGNWSFDVFLIWIFNAVFFQLGMLYVHNRIALHKKRNQITGLADKIRLTGNIIASWFFCILILSGLSLTGAMKPVFLLIFLPISIHILVGLYIDKRELNIKRMGYSLLGEDVFFLVLLISLFRA